MLYSFFNIKMSLESREEWNIGLDCIIGEKTSRYYVIITYKK